MAEGSGGVAGGGASVAVRPLGAGEVGQWLDFVAACFAAKVSAVSVAAPLRSAVRRRGAAAVGGCARGGKKE